MEHAIFVLCSPLAVIVCSRAETRCLLRFALVLVAGGCGSVVYRIGEDFQVLSCFRLTWRVSLIPDATSCDCCRNELRRKWVCSLVGMATDRLVAD